MLILMSDMLTRIRLEFAERIAVLRPMAEEHERLQRAADALDRISANGVAVLAPPLAAPVRVPAKAAPVKRSSRRRSSRSRLERAAPGQTQTRVIEQLRTGPGSTSTAVAAALGISANAAAATISRLVKQGRVQRLDAGGYSAAEPASPAAATAD